MFLDLPCFLIYPLFYTRRYYITTHIVNSLYKDVLVHCIVVPVPVASAASVAVFLDLLYRVS
jgi:hypothetical protein